MLAALIFLSFLLRLMKLDPAQATIKMKVHRFDPRAGPLMDGSAPIADWLT
jgi:hypothetical protein